MSQQEKPISVPDDYVISYQFLADAQTVMNGSMKAVDLSDHEIVRCFSELPMIADYIKFWRNVGVLRFHDRVEIYWGGIR
jgi:hypothetical protein